MRQDVKFKIYINMGSDKMHQYFKICINMGADKMHQDVLLNPYQHGCRQNAPNLKTNYKKKHTMLQYTKKEEQICINMGANKMHQYFKIRINMGADKMHQDLKQPNK